MSEPPSRSLQLLAQLETQIEHLATLETEVKHWQAVAERHRQKSNRLERQMYRITPQFMAERDGLNQERDAAHRVLAQLVDLLLPVLEEASLEQVDINALRGVVESAMALLKDPRFLDKTNLDKTAFNDPI